MQLLNSLSHAVNRLASFLSCILLVSLVVLVSIAIIFRFVLVKPLAWTEELARYLFLWSAFLGIAVAESIGTHVRVTILLDSLSVAKKNRLEILSRLCSLAFIVVIFPKSIELAKMTHAQISPTLRIPMSYVYGAIPISLGLVLFNMLTTFLAQIPTLKTGRREGGIEL
jgi:TRAP-type C4-dicarboxylate transport system permease small subunit